MKTRIYAAPVVEGLTIQYVGLWYPRITINIYRYFSIPFKSGCVLELEWKWNESGFRPPLCTYRLNWARRTSWGWWDDWDDTVLQTQDSKFEPWRSEAEHATSRSRRLPTILTFTRGWGRNIFVSFKPPRPGTEPRTLAWKAAVLTTTLGPPPRTWMERNVLYLVNTDVFICCYKCVSESFTLPPLNM